VSRRRVVVLGGGIAGLSTAHALALDGGVDVTLVEREPRHDAHSTGRSAEILRVAVDDPVTRGLSLETDRLLDDPRGAGLDAGPLVERTGLIVLADDDPPWADDLERRGLSLRADASSLRHRVADLQESEGALRLGGRAHWIERGGRILGDRLVASLARCAHRAGATFVRSAGDAEVLVDGRRVRGVRIRSGERIAADQVVVAAGAWTGPIARGLGLDLPLRTTRRHMFLSAPAPGGPAAPPVVWDDDDAFYIRREGTRWGLSICDVAEAAPAAPLYPVDPGVERRAAEALAAWVQPSAGPVALETSWSGFRDLSPDDRPILGPDPRQPGLHWCCGLGGHGMTLSLGLGRAAASAVLGHPTELAAQCTVERFEFAPA